MVGQLWDVSLTRVRVNGRAASDEHDGIRISLPQPLARALMQRGYTRATMRVTDDGILITPHTGDKQGATAALPQWDGATA